MRYFLWLLGLIGLSPLSLTHADAPPMCQGETALLAISDRPSIAFSACPVPKQTLYLESGYVSELLIGGSLGQQFPQPELRYGLTDTTEINWFPPTYDTQRRPALSGASENAFAIKHVISSNNSHTWTGQAILGLPTGSQAFGARQYGLTLNSIYTHSLPHDASITGILGFSSASTSPLEGNEQFYSFNPIILISPPTIGDRIAPYIEFYGQSKMAPDQNWGINFD